jgi:hypothetical protein
MSIVILPSRAARICRRRSFIFSLCRPFAKFAARRRWSVSTDLSINVAISSVVQPISASLATWEALICLGGLAIQVKICSLSVVEVKPVMEQRARFAQSDKKDTSHPNLEHAELTYSDSGNVGVGRRLDRRRKAA